MTRRERLERKLGKRKEWAEGRKVKASAEWEKGDMGESKSGIPFGQPILVGHHSEGRHRRAIERAEKSVNRAIENGKMAENHENKADGIERQLSRSIFSDDENAVEALEARIAANEAERKTNNAINKIIRKKPKAEATTEKIAALVSLGLSEDNAAKMFDKDFCGRIGIPSYVNSNIGGRIQADRKRLERVKLQQENKQAAEGSESGITVKKNGRGWYFVTFAEKPEREILTALKSAGYRWRLGSWVGNPDKLPGCVKDLVA